jgi:Domain of unknown function (DUF4159)
MRGDGLLDPQSFDSAPDAEGSAWRGKGGLPRRELLAGLLGSALLLWARRARALGDMSRFRLLRLRLPDLPDPRPSAARRLAWELERRTSLLTIADAIELPLGNPDLFHYPLCVLSGDRGFAMPSEADLLHLRRYLTFGGCLLIDSAEGKAGGGFDASVRKLLAHVLPGDSAKPVRDDHVLWKSFYVLRDLPGRVLVTPTLEAVERDRRLAVIYTQNDLMGAMARDGFGRWEHDVVPGGDEQRERCFRFAVNVVMYALCLDYKSEQAHIDFIMRTRRSSP